MDLFVHRYWLDGYIDTLSIGFEIVCLNGNKEGIKGNSFIVIVNVKHLLLVVVDYHFRLGSS